MSNAITEAIAGIGRPTTRIMMPFELASGAEQIQSQRLDNQIKQKSLQPQELSEKEKLENAISRVAYVGQQVQPFVDQKYTPHLDLRYRNTKARIEQELGMKMSNLPDKYDPVTLKDVYRQGMTIAQNLVEKHKAFDQGMDTQEFDYKKQHDQDVLKSQEQARALGQYNTDRNFAETVRGHDIQASNQGWAQTVGPDGLPVWTQKRSEGMPAYSPTAQVNKPMPPTSLKMQNESLEAISTASNIKTDLSELKNQIESGNLNLGLFSNIANKGLNKAGISTEESRNFATLENTLARLRNDSLRLNKGVQTEGDAVRAWEELINNINDKDLVKKRLEEITRLNDRAVNQHRLNIDTIRSNYGKDPIDTSSYENQQSSVINSNQRGVMTATNPSTGERIKSLDGGKTWQSIR
jgi:hypothetical protein